MTHFTQFSADVKSGFAAIWKHGGEEFEFAEPLTRQDFEAAEKEDDEAEGEAEGEATQVAIQTEGED